MKCKKCGHDLAAGIKFCPECGEAVVPPTELERIEALEVQVADLQKQIETLKRETAEKIGQAMTAAATSSDLDDRNVLQRLADWVNAPVSSKGKVEK